MVFRYYTLRKLGWGHFATVWLAFDTKDRNFAAIKIPKSRQDFIEASRDELDVIFDSFISMFFQFRNCRFYKLYVMGILVILELKMWFKF